MMYKKPLQIITAIVAISLIVQYVRRFLFVREHYELISGKPNAAVVKGGFFPFSDVSISSDKNGVTEGASMF